MMPASRARENPGRGWKRARNAGCTGRHAARNGLVPGGRSLERPAPSDDHLPTCPLPARAPEVVSMRRIPTLILLVTLASMATGAAPPPKRPGAGTKPRPPGATGLLKNPLQSMVAAEQEFAKLAGTHGTRAAFLANVADDAVLFDPLPVNGRERYQARPESKALLAWEPAWAEVAGSGDFGVTSGPWE